MMNDLNALLMKPCATDDALHAWVRLFVGLDVPRVAVCPTHQPPFEYLRRSYFEPTRDVVVWAPRGGGKTRLAAVATLLDLLHKPGASVRILGGSLEQSMKMWDYLLPDLHRLAKRQLVQTQGKQLKLAGGGTAAVLTQSQKAVRGMRVQKLRCDEVELFDPDVWEAAQLTTRSLDTKAGRVSGAVEALSTFHAVGGLMETLTDAAGEHGCVRWCLLDVLERCPPERECRTCPLLTECHGVAKDARGFVPIDDAVQMKARVSAETWESEMLCRRPSVRGRVFPSFDEAVHVTDEEVVGETQWSIDFGFAAPFVCLSIVESAGAVTVVDEYAVAGRTLDEHLDACLTRGRPVRVTCDPAGAARSGQTALSDVQVLRRRGLKVSHRPSRIADGLEAIRRSLRAADGRVSLKVHRRCTRLIRSLRAYRYPDGGGEIPLKDGEHDHAVDALRYWFVNQSAGKVTGRRY